MYGWLNISKYINIIYFISRFKEKGYMFIFIDGEKVFDKFNNYFLYKYLRNSIR